MTVVLLVWFLGQLQPPVQYVQPEQCERASLEIRAASVQFKAECVGRGSVA